MKLLAILISLVMMTGKIEKAEMLAMLVSAEDCAEKALGEGSWGGRPVHHARLTGAAFLVRKVR